MKTLLRHPVGITISVLVLAALILTTILMATKPPSLNDGSTASVRVDQGTVKAKVAATDASRGTGLAGSQPLDDQHGMLFIFPDSDLRSFFMKGVSYPIDIIWIAGDTVSEVTANVPPAAAGTPDDQLPRYKSNFPVNRVLEVKAGWAAAHSIQPGDPVRISR